jgi:integrase-like protein
MAASLVRRAPPTQVVHGAGSITTTRSSPDTLLRAEELRAKRGLPPLPPGLTVHALRRTYVSLMLAAGVDLRWVQAQVGHEDAKMTLEVYTQVLQRKDRDLYTEAFDRLMADAIPAAATPKDQRQARRRISRIPGNPCELRPRFRPQQGPPTKCQPSPNRTHYEEPSLTRGFFRWS